MCGCVAYVDRLYCVGASLTCSVHSRRWHSTIPPKRNFAGVSFTASYYLLLIPIMLRQLCVALALLSGWIKGQTHTCRMENICPVGS